MSGPEMYQQTHQPPLIAYRSWIPIPGRYADVGLPVLREPQGKRDSWRPGINVSRCMIGWTYQVPHLAAQPFCTCGVEAFHAPLPNWPAHHVWGVIIGWGHAVIYRDSLRIQKAKILALAEHPKVDLEEFSARYGAPIMAADILPAYAQYFGTNMRPEGHDRLIDATTMYCRSPFEEAA